MDACLNFDPARRPDASVLLRTLQENYTPGKISLRENNAPQPDPTQAPANQPREDEVQLAARRNRSGQGGFADVAGMEGLKEELLKRVI